MAGQQTPQTSCISYVCHSGTVAISKWVWKVCNLHNPPISICGSGGHIAPHGSCLALSKRCNYDPTTKSWALALCASLTVTQSKTSFNTENKGGSDSECHMVFVGSHGQAVWQFISRSAKNLYANQCDCKRLWKQPCNPGLWCDRQNRF